MTKTIGIIALKGGVGKTTTTLNLGAVLAREFDKKVLIVDANFSAPNLGLHLGLANHGLPTIHHALLRRENIQDTINEYEDNLHIIPGSLISRKVSPFLLKEKLKSVKDNYDYILLDSSPSLNEEILSTMIASDYLLVVTTPDIPTLSTTMRAIRIAKQKKTPIKGLILNKLKNKKFELSIDEIEESSGVPVIATLPDDVKILEALSKSKHIAEHSPKRNFAYELRNLGAFITGDYYKDPRLLTKLKNIFR